MAKCIKFCYVLCIAFKKQRALSVDSGALVLIGSLLA